MSEASTTAVVTGAMGAIGSEVVRQLLLHDWDVLGVDLQTSHEMGPKWVEADVRDEVEMAQLADGLGPVGLLVNAHAAWPPGKPAVEVEDDHWIALLENNLKGTFFSCRALYQNLLRASGTIVNIASATAHQAFLNHAHYCAANRAITSLTEVLALEWARTGIRVFALGLGPVRTPALESAWSQNPDREREVLSMLPQSRLPLPAEVAHAIVSLAGGRFSYLNGSSVVLDGGLAIAGGY